MENKKLCKIIVIIIILFLSTCGSKSVRNARENAILRQYSKQKEEKYSDLLVDINRYTTNGGVYHKKYYKYLIGIADDVTEKKRLEIVRGTLGFYFDKKSQSKNKLYIGLDINSRTSDDEKYTTVAYSLIRKYIKEIIQTIHSCKTIFDESEIIGMVVGFKWISNGNDEQINIWINEKDVLKFENGSLTFEELVQRSTITNTSGRIIRIPI